LTLKSESEFYNSVVDIFDHRNGNPEAQKRLIDLYDKRGDMNQIDFIQQMMDIGNEYGVSFRDVAMENRLLDYYDQNDQPEKAKELRLNVIALDKIFKFPQADDKTNPLSLSGKYARDPNPGLYDVAKNAVDEMSSGEVEMRALRHVGAIEGGYQGHSEEGYVQELADMRRIRDEVLSTRDRKEEDVFAKAIESFSERPADYYVQERIKEQKRQRAREMGEEFTEDSFSDEGGSTLSSDDFDHMEDISKTGKQGKDDFVL